jgi:hypothetical protein
VQGEHELMFVQFGAQCAEEVKEFAMIGLA